MGSPKLRQDRVREAAVGYSTYEGAATGVVYGVSGSTGSATNGAAGVTGYAGAATGQVNGVAGTSLSTAVRV